MRMMMFEKVHFKNSRNLVLTGSLVKAPSDRIIIMAHGSGGNRLAHGLFSKIAETLQKVSCSTLAFDFSGHGESQDDILTLEHSGDDVRAAIAFAQQRGYKHIALLGHSLGAYACLKAFSSDVETMILLGALTGPVDWYWEDMCSQEQLEMVRDKGYIALEVNDDLRKTLTIDGNLLNDIRAINQKNIMSCITCPVLIIHGDADQQERDLYEYSQKALDYVLPESRLVVIPGAEHNFLEHSDKVIELIKEWIAIHFKF